MSDESKALQEAQQKITELLEAAKAGSIIPIRLPGQVEEIANLVKQAEAEHAAELKDAAAKAGPADLQE